ncbi:hypothetical protein LCGC14_0818300 [marine sediment metagenome]|uniref:DUF551 domain-containing protein n=1 Tax=marine sediment metagenome TaxID=412755 RepID=A0A0F9PP85_9ZZZZ
MPEWTSAEETTPQDGQLVYVFNEGIGVQKGRYEENDRGNIWSPDGSLVTHWMPRKPDPDEGEAD